MIVLFSSSPFMLVRCWFFVVVAGAFVVVCLFSVYRYFIVITLSFTDVIYIRSLNISMLFFNTGCI